MSNIVEVKGLVMSKRIVCMVYLLMLVCQLAFAQKMGFETESNSARFQGGVSNRQLTEVAFKGKKGEVRLRKGDLVDQAPGYKHGQVPLVHPTFEIIDKSTHPVEFVSDPIPFERGLNDICRVTKDLQQMLDLVRQRGTENNILDNYFRQRGLDLENTNNGALDQALQITFSFPINKGMLSLRALSRFLAARQAEPAPQNQPPWFKAVDYPLFSHIITFIDTDPELRNYPDNVKFFLFFVLQYFSLGSQANCNAGPYAKLVSGMVLLRTNMYEFVNHGGQSSVRNLLKNPLESVVEAYERFRAYFNPIRGHTPQLGECVSHPKCIGQCLGQSKTYYFAKTHELNSKFPFSANEFIQNLFRNNGRDLFSTNGEDFDNAFGRFGVNVGGQATVIYEIRFLNGFSYSDSQQSVSALQSRIPSYFNLGNEIMNQNDLQKIDVGVKICNNQQQLVALQAPQQPPAQQQHAPAPLQQQQQIHIMREDRRNVNEAIRDQRQQRRSSISNLAGAPNPASGKHKKVGATVLSNEEPNHISILREKRRRVRVQKRFDRELRRTKEAQKNPSQKPTKAQIRREALRLAREKKRLAREEERDVEAGVKPVTDQDLKQIIQKQKEKKKEHFQQTVIPAGGISHQVVKNGNDVQVNIKLRLYE
nr:unnamed protein product [Naegleria fowleri]